MLANRKGNVQQNLQSRINDINVNVPFHKEHQFTTAVSCTNDALWVQAAVKSTRLGVIIRLTSVTHSNSLSNNELHIVIISIHYKWFYQF